MPHLLPGAGEDRLLVLPRDGSAGTFVVSSTLREGGERDSPPHWTLRVLLEPGDEAPAQWWLGSWDASQLAELENSLDEKSTLPALLAASWIPDRLAISLVEDASSDDEDVVLSPHKRRHADTQDALWRSETGLCVLLIGAPPRQLRLQLPRAQRAEALQHASRVVAQLAPTAHQQAESDAARAVEAEAALVETQRRLDQERTKYRELLSADPKLRARYSSTSIANPGRIRRQSDLGGFEGDA